MPSFISQEQIAFALPQISISFVWKIISCFYTTHIDYTAYVDKSCTILKYNEHNIMLSPYFFIFSSQA